MNRRGRGRACGWGECDVGSNGRRRSWAARSTPTVRAGGEQWFGGIWIRRAYGRDWRFHRSVYFGYCPSDGRDEARARRGLMSGSRKWLVGGRFFGWLRQSRWIRGASCDFQFEKLLAECVLESTPRRSPGSIKVGPGQHAGNGRMWATLLAAEAMRSAAHQFQCPVVAGGLEPDPQGGLRGRGGDRHRESRADFQDRIFMELSIADCGPAPGQRAATQSSLRLNAAAADVPEMAAAGLDCRDDILLPPCSVPMQRGGPRGVATMVADVCLPHVPARRIAKSVRGRSFADRTDFL